MGIRSNGELEKLRKQIVDASRGAFKAKLIGAAVNQARKIIASEFRASKDPNDEPWKKLQGKRQGERKRGKPLLKTRALSKSFVVEPTDRGFKVSTRIFYAPFHQRGTKTIPKRQMIPENGLTAKWLDPIDKAVTAAASRFFK